MTSTSHSGFLLTTHRRFMARIILICVNFPDLGTIRQESRLIQLLEYGYYAFVQISPFYSLTMVPIVFMDLDPLFLVLNEFPVFQVSSIPKYLVVVPFRICVLSWCALEVLKSFCSLSIMGLILLLASTQIMSRCIKGTEIGANGQTRVIQVYKEMQIWNDYVNQTFCYFAIPPILFFGMCITIVATT